MMFGWIITLALMILIPLIVAAIASRTIKDIDLNLFLLCLGMTTTLIVWVGMLEVYFFVLPAAIYTFILLRGDEVSAE